MMLWVALEEKASTGQKGGSGQNRVARCPWLAVSPIVPFPNFHGALEYCSIVHCFQKLQLHPQLVAFQKRFRLLELPQPEISLNFTATFPMRACCNQECRT